MKLWFCVLATEETSTDDKGLVNVRLHLAMAHSLLPARRSNGTRSSNNPISLPLFEMLFNRPTDSSPTGTEAVAQAPKLSQVATSELTIRR